MSVPGPLDRPPNVRPLGLRDLGLRDLASVTREERLSHHRAPSWLEVALEKLHADPVLFALADMLAKEWCDSFSRLPRRSGLERLPHRCDRAQAAERLLANLLAMPKSDRVRLARRLEGRR